MKPQTKLPLARRLYDAERSAAHSIDRVIEDIRAADRLGIPFTVMTTHRRAYRGGGNINKTDIYEYHVKIGEITELGDEA